MKCIFLNLLSNGYFTVFSEIYGDLIKKIMLIKIKTSLLHLFFIVDEYGAVH